MFVPHLCVYILSENLSFAHVLRRSLPGLDVLPCTAINIVCRETYGCSCRKSTSLQEITRNVRRKKPDFVPSPLIVRFSCSVYRHFQICIFQFLLCFFFLLFFSLESCISTAVHDRTIVHVCNRNFRQVFMLPICCECMVMMHGTSSIPMYIQSTTVLCDILACVHVCITIQCHI